MSDEDRLAKVESRLDKIETLIEQAEALIAKVRNSPQAKTIMKMLGIELS